MLPTYRVDVVADECDAVQSKDVGVLEEPPNLHLLLKALRPTDVKHRIDTH